MSAQRDKLHRAFARLMERRGTPIERVEQPEAARGSGRGPKPAVFRVTGTGQTIRLRTNAKPAIITKVEDGRVEARLPFEGEDSLGAIYPTPGRPGWATAYLVPSAVAAAKFRANHRTWLAADPEHARTNDTRVIRFTEAQVTEWAEYCLGEIELTEPASPENGGDITACVREMRQVAERHGYQAVRISIELAPDLIAHF